MTMVKKLFDAKDCANEVGTVAQLYRDVPPIVRRLVKSWRKNECFDQEGSIPNPSHEAIIKIIEQSRRVLFPGYFTQATINPANLEYYLGQELTGLLETLSQQINLSIQHDCFRFDQPCSHCNERGHLTALKFIQTLPRIADELTTDIRATMEGDPAAKGYDEIIFSYPGLLAITVYRLAHELINLQVPVIPRIMTEHAHSLTGIDIHPGATIGKNFFIDHGTGVVVGETTEIGNRVRIYQGVTLGALSLPRDAGDRYRNKKRHPTIEDEVIIYANTTILGGETVIGARSIIGGNIWITESVPPDTKVLLKRPELLYIGNNKKKTKSRRGK